uniref:Uncharacterized protein n=1 Tax=Timema bartmani TaxID=61472 RepID=A0A7R9F3Q6_9NEOP|nr:unnamed protein product [Timema bartmani]
MTSHDAQIGTHTSTASRRATQDLSRIESSERSSAPVTGGGTSRSIRWSHSRSVKSLRHVETQAKTISRPDENQGPPPLQEPQIVVNPVCYSDPSTNLTAAGAAGSFGLSVSPVSNSASIVEVNPIGSSTFLPGCEPAATYGIDSPVETLPPISSFHCRPPQGVVLLQQPPITYSHVTQQMTTSPVEGLYLQTSPDLDEVAASNHSLPHPPLYLQDPPVSLYSSVATTVPVPLESQGVIIPSHYFSQDPPGAQQHLFPLSFLSDDTVAASQAQSGVYLLNPSTSISTMPILSPPKSTSSH